MASPRSGCATVSVAYCYYFSSASPTTRRTACPLPDPDERVRGSRSGRPIMAALDLLGRRWALRVVWELRDGALTFRELRTRCDDVSPTVLNQRLAELREAGIVAHGEGEGYAFTAVGVRAARGARAAARLGHALGAKQSCRPANADPPSSPSPPRPALRRSRRCRSWGRGAA